MRERVALLMALAAEAVTGSARADIKGPSPVAERVARADVVFVGKVTSIEDKTVKAASPYGGTDKVEYQVAVVKVEEAIAGLKDVTHVRVGFLPQGVRRRFPHLDLTVGQEACFFLRRHPDDTFHVIPMYYDVVNKDDKTTVFKDSVEEARTAAKVLADPKAALASKDAVERQRAAVLLLTHYRTRPVGKSEDAKSEVVPADVSKRLLENLAEAEWTKIDPKWGYELAPRTVFLHLGLTSKDGWTAPKDLGQFPEQAKKWLRANADTYQLRRFVRAPAK